MKKPQKLLSALALFLSSISLYAPEEIEEPEDPTLNTNDRTNRGGSDLPPEVLRNQSNPASRSTTPTSPTTRPVTPVIDGRLENPTAPIVIVNSRPTTPITIDPTVSPQVRTQITNFQSSVDTITTQLATAQAKAGKTTGLLNLSDLTETTQSLGRQIRQLQDALSTLPEDTQAQVRELLTQARDAYSQSADFIIDQKTPPVIKKVQKLLQSDSAEGSSFQELPVSQQVSQLMDSVETLSLLYKTNRSVVESTIQDISTMLAPLKKQMIQTITELTNQTEPLTDDQQAELKTSLNVLDNNFMTQLDGPFADFLTDVGVYPTPEELANFKELYVKGTGTLHQDAPQQLVASGITQDMTTQALQAQKTQTRLSLAFDTLTTLLANEPNSTATVQLITQVHTKVTELNSLINTIQDPASSADDQETAIVSLLAAKDDLKPLFEPLSKVLKDVSSQLEKTPNDQTLQTVLDTLKEFNSSNNKFNTALSKYTKALPSTLHVEWDKSIKEKIIGLSKSLNPNESGVAQEVNGQQLIQSLQGVVDTIAKIAEEALKNTNLYNDYQSMVEGLTLKLIPLTRTALETISNLDMDVMTDQKEKISTLLTSLPDFLDVFKKQGNLSVSDQNIIKEITTYASIVKDDITIISNSDTLQNQLKQLQKGANGTNFITRFFQNYMAFAKQKVFNAPSSAQAVTDYVNQSNTSVTTYQNAIKRYSEKGIKTDSDRSKVSSYLEALKAQKEILESMAKSSKEVGAAFALGHDLATASSQALPQVENAINSAIDALTQSGNYNVAFKALPDLVVEHIENDLATLSTADTYPPVLKYLQSPEGTADYQITKNALKKLSPSVRKTTLIIELDLMRLQLNPGDKRTSLINSGITTAKKPIPALWNNIKLLFGKSPEVNGFVDSVNDIVDEYTNQIITLNGDPKNLDTSLVLSSLDNMKDLDQLLTDLQNQVNDPNTPSDVKASLNKVISQITTPIVTAQKAIETEKQTFIESVIKQQGITTEGYDEDDIKLILSKSLSDERQKYAAYKFTKEGTSIKDQVDIDLTSQDTINRLLELMGFTKRTLNTFQTMTYDQFNNKIEQLKSETKLGTHSSNIDSRIVRDWDTTASQNGGYKLLQQLAKTGLTPELDEQINNGYASYTKLDKQAALIQALM